MQLTKEYLTLFNAITDALERLDRLSLDLAAAQALAEEIYISTAEEASDVSTASAPLPSPI